MRYLVIYRPETGEEGGAPDPAHMQSMNALVEDMTKAGKLIVTEPLAMRAQGAAVRLSGGKLTVSDLTARAAGYAFINAASRDEAIALIGEFLGVAGDAECEIRLVLEFGPPPS